MKCLGFLVNEAQAYAGCSGVTVTVDPEILIALAKVVEAAEVLREWHRGEYQSNRDLDATFDVALTRLEAALAESYPALLQVR